ncbi:MAG: PhoX family protein, partial [Gemmatimonadaceae bacterium]|nr:PhoX family protein [Gemmatimonadaceae bacterium]
MRADPVLARRRFLALSAATAGAATLGLSPFGRLLAQAGLPKGRVAGFGPLAPVADAATGLPLLLLPEGFRYRSFGWSNTPMADGRPTPSHHDGMGIVRADGPRLTLVRNHECPGDGPSFGDAGMTYDADMDGGTTTLVFDGAKGELLESRASLAGTLRNCAGGTTPWGSWLSCEEQVVDPGRVAFDERVVDVKRPHGFVFEVPHDGASRAEPLVAMGQRVHEAAAVHAASGDVFLTEDADPVAGFYRFVPDVRGELHRGGALWMLKAEGAPDLRRGHRTGDRFKATWVRIEHPERGMGERSKGDGNVREGLANGGSAFLRLEGCYAHGDTIYFTSTSGGDAGSGQVWAYDAVAAELQL